MMATRTILYAAISFALLGSGELRADDGKTSDNAGKVSAEVSGSVGRRESARAETGGDNWHADVEGGTTAEARLKVSADDNGNYGVQTSAKVGVDGSVTVGVNRQLGDDQNNIHGSGELTLSAEVVAEIAGQFTVNEDGTVVAKAEAEIGAAVSADATIKGGVTVWGVPIDVVLTGGVSAGAKASASAGAEFDAKKGTIKVTLEASAVLGVGAQGSLSVEIGIVQLAQAMVDVGRIKETVGGLWDWLDEKIKGKPGDDGGDPFDSDPGDGGGSAGDANRYNGLRALKLID